MENKNSTELEIVIKSVIVQDGNQRKIGHIEYKHGDARGYDILQVLTTVLSETLIRSRPKTQLSDEDWLEGVIELQGKALKNTMVIRMQQKETEH